MPIENTFNLIKKKILSLGNLAFYLAERSKKDNILQTSAALAYASLIGLVPLLAIALAIFSAFPVFEAVKDDLQVFIFENFAPHASEPLRERISNFVLATGGLTAVGVVGLAFTSVFMLNKIEDAFNAIFRVNKPRTIIARVMMYWTILTFCPLLIGASFSFSGHLSEVKGWFQREAYVSENNLNLIIPFIFFSIGFMLLYIAVPNRLVKIKYALIGGVAAAFLFNLLKASFGYFVAAGTAYQVIYGALAALPLFLLWIYLSWTVVLLGAEITATIPEWIKGAKPSRGKINHSSESGAKFVAVAISLVEALWQTSKKCYNIKKQKLTAMFNISEIDYDFVITKLKQNNIVALTEDGELVLTREPSSFTVLELAEIFGVTADCDVDKLINTNVSKKIKNIFAETKKAEAEKLSVPVLDIISS